MQLMIGRKYNTQKGHYSYICTYKPKLEDNTEAFFPYIGYILLENGHFLPMAWNFQGEAYNSNPYNTEMNLVVPEDDSDSK